jgi:tape measure domain-containing protein
MGETQVYTLSLRDLFSSKVQDANSAAHKLADTMREVATAVGIAFTVDKIYEFGKEVLHTAAEFEGFRNVIKYSSKDAADGKQNLDYLNDAVTRLNLPIKEAYENFSELQAGLLGTGVEGDKLRGVFEGLGTASAVMHLSSDQFSRAGYALKEIGELGTLQSRQMRMLALALPGSMELAAEAMKKTPKQLREAMEAGEIEAAPFMEAFGKKLKEHFEAGLPNAGDSLISQMNKASNSFVKMQLELGEKLRPMYIKLLNTITDFFNSLKSGIGWIEEHKDGMLAISKGVEAATITYGIYLGIVKSVALWEWILNERKKMGIFLTELLTGYELARAEGMSVLTAAQWALNVAMDANPIGIIIVAVGALAAGIYYLWHHFAKVRATILAVWEVMKSWVSDMKDLLGGLFKIIHGIFTFNFAEVSSGLSSISSVYRVAGQHMAEAWKAGWDNVMATDETPIDGGTLVMPADMVGKKRKVKDKTKNQEDGLTNGKTDQAKAVGTKAVTINVKIDNLVREFKVHTQNIQEGASKAKEIVAQALLSAVNDTQIVAGQ